ncbi:LysR family transcriptional regulator [Roseofilum reptotaenium CS-1145]|uniref:HTH lysR-type domain-containing protein n=1 Tax=Roseofilum reptotaenium AO1-A TaxID=1925591 RepID=A0A1L9QQB9_9CYAN|nr:MULTISPECIES: LysR family transcriptional regulator [Roseofilum]MBP0029766.1 LysR family transcriptional regulator [Roseofilum sp. Guam]MDB9520050.1 LysR family transcriptional regulator [Roseofilum reptotaenium CS-1145]OJJ24839.1 hypothetical protein BI308_14845 [Roseofilum reptotaenium AO1-A]
MELSLLKTFVDVVKQGSFAAVARERNVDPSSVSRAIARLETELSLRLLQRTLLPSWLIADDLRDRKLINVFPYYAVTATSFNTAAWLLYPSRAYIPLKVQVFIDFLKQSISGEV